MRARPSISLAERFPAAYLFLHSWATGGDYSSSATRHILTMHRLPVWWIS